MDDDLIDDARPDGSDAELSPRQRVISGIVVLTAVLGVSYLMLRVSSPPVPPTQVAPEPHWGPGCAWCHNVSETAKPIEVQK